MAAGSVRTTRRPPSAVRGAGRPARDPGFTLVEILIAIVLVGILSVVVVVGIGQLTDKASTAACAASADASRVASTTYFANTGTYPTSFADLTSSSTTGGPALVLATGTTAVGRTITAANWTLTMSATAPPTYTCSAGASASTVAGVTTMAPTTAPPTTVAPTTAPPTTVAANGVTATVGTSGDARYYGEATMTLNNTSTMTAMSVTISVVQTAGVTYQSQYTNFWGGTVSMGHPTLAGTIRYTFDIVAGQTIVSGSWTLVGQFGGTGTAHPTSGDTWSVTSTSGGITNTISGTF